jgi:hypothetical protein
MAQTVIVEISTIEERKWDVLVEPVALVPALVVPEPASDLVDVWGLDSFPASDPPANW